MERRISIKQVLVDLISILPQITKEFANEFKYEKLIAFLNAKDYANNDELRYPTLKQISEETGIKALQLRKQLKEIYDSLFEYDNEFTFDFSKVEIRITAEYLKSYASFTCGKLHYLPRVGENIVLPFLNAKVGTSHFYVDDINHGFEADKQIIELYLKGGIYNSYWRYRMHKALELGEISLTEHYNLYEFQLKERLGLRR